MSGENERRGGIAGFDLNFGNTKVAGDQAASSASSSQAQEKQVEARQSLRVVVVSELTARPDYSTGASPPAQRYAVDAITLDALFRQLSPSLAIEVADPFLSSAKPLRVDLRWTEWKSLRLHAMVEQIPALRGLIDARRIVQRCAAKQLSRASASDQLVRVLANQAWSDAIERSLADSGAVADRASSGEGGASGGGNDPIESILQFMDQRRKGELAEFIPASTDNQADAPQVSEEKSERPSPSTVVENAFARLLTSIIQHPEVRRLESAWRGLRFFLQQAGRESVEVQVVPAAMDEVGSALDRLATIADAQAIDLVVVDATISASTPDLSLLEKWAAAAERLGAPLLVGGEANLMGFDSMEKLQRSQRRLSSIDDPRAIAARAVSSRESARWVGMVLNRVLLRSPYSTASSRITDMPFAEPKASGKVFGNGAYVVAALAASSQSANGHPFFMTGPRHGSITGLDVHELSDQGVTIAVPTEGFATIEVQNEAARAGFMVLGAAANRDAVILAKMPMFYRGPSAAQGGDPAAPVSLADQFMVARLARAVDNLAAAIPEGSDTKAVVDVVRIAVAQLFEGVLPLAPEVLVRFSPQGRLEVTVKPHGQPLFGIEEVSLAANLGG